MLVPIINRSVSDSLTPSEGGKEAASSLKGYSAIKITLYKDYNAYHSLCTLHHPYIRVSCVDPTW